MRGSAFSVLVCMRVYQRVALERVFYLLSHGCHCDRLGAAVAHGNQISVYPP